MEFACKFTTFNAYLQINMSFVVFFLISKGFIEL